MSQAVTTSHIHDHYLESGEHLISHDAKLSDIGVWLSKGWHDIAYAPVASLFYGFIMTAFVMGVYVAFSEEPIMIFKLATFFVMLSPFLATGLYYVAQQLELKRRPSLFDSMSAWRSNSAEITLYALILGVVIAIWSRITPLIAAVAGSDSLLIVDPDAGIMGFLTSEAGVSFMVSFMIGAVAVAAFVFTVSVITLPLLLRDRNVGVITAMILSYKVVMENKGVMFAWAMTIGALLTLGIVTLGIAMIVVMPLLGYASWHAFSQLIEFDSSQASR